MKHNENNTVKFVIKESVYKKKIEELDLSVRAYNCLRRAKMETIEDILDRQHELSHLRGCGANTVREIKNKIVKLSNN